MYSNNRQGFEVSNYGRFNEDWAILEKLMVFFVYRHNTHELGFHNLWKLKTNRPLVDTPHLPPPAKKIIIRDTLMQMKWMRWSVKWAKSLGNKALLVSV